MPYNSLNSHLYVLFKWICLHQCQICPNSWRKEKRSWLSGVSWVVPKTVQHLSCNYLEVCWDPPAPPTCPERLQRWPGRGAETQPSYTIQKILIFRLHTVMYSKNSEECKHWEMCCLIPVHEGVRGERERLCNDGMFLWGESSSFLSLCVFLLSHTEGMNVKSCSLSERTAIQWRTDTKN